MLYYSNRLLMESQLNFDKTMTHYLSPFMKMFSNILPRLEFFRKYKSGRKGNEAKFM